MKIGLTGGIASGKSTTSDILKELGANLIDADKVAHTLMQPKKRLWEEVVKEFGEEILLSNNRIDRKQLGNIIFNNQQAKDRLDQITHPIIIKKIKEKMSLLEKQGEIIIVDVPLLIEADMIDLFDKIWLVYVEKDIQITRLMNRDNISYQAAISRINSQMSLSDKKRYADKIIENNGTKEELKIKLEKIWRNI